MDVDKARLDKLVKEQEDAVRLKIKTKYVCMSSECHHHETLHGEILDFDEAMKIFSLENIPDECRCACIQILVDDAGNPTTPGVVERIRNQKK